MNGNFKEYFEAAKFFNIEFQVAASMLANYEAVQGDLELNLFFETIQIYKYENHV